MNNSDHNDFQNWQNGDENEMNNPNNHMGGFFYFGDPKFREMWKKIQNNEDPTEHIRDYLNIDDIMNQWGKNNPPQKYNRRQPKPKKTTVTFTQEEYMKLIEIRGYLAITEQFAHVKALDKLLKQIITIPIDPRRNNG